MLATFWVGEPLICAFNELTSHNSAQGRCIASVGIVELVSPLGLSKTLFFLNERVDIMVADYFTDTSCLQPPILHL